LLVFLLSKYFHNPMHLANYRVRDGLEVFTQHLYPFSPKRSYNQQNIS